MAPAEPSCRASFALRARKPGGALCVLRLLAPEDPNACASKTGECARSRLRLKNRRMRALTLAPRKAGIARTLRAPLCWLLRTQRLGLKRRWFRAGERAPSC